MPRLILGTRNKKKISEITPLLADLAITLVDVSQLPDVPEIAEEGRTFLANASAKAQGVAQASGEWTLAEDSGLVVPALNGEPGVDSAIYAGQHGDDAVNNAKLLMKIAKVPETERRGVLCLRRGVVQPAGRD